MGMSCEVLISILTTWQQQQTYFATLTWYEVKHNLSPFGTNKTHNFSFLSFPKLGFLIVF
jgi:hypothetical protein